MLEMMSSRCRPPRGLGEKKKGKKWAVWRTVQSNHPVSQRRQGPGVSGVMGCGGNRKRRTPTPQEHEGSDQLAGLPPRRGGAPGWREAVGKWGGGGGGLGQGGGWGCRVQTKQHSQRNIWNTERKSFILLRARCSAVATATGINSLAFTFFCCFLFSNRVVFNTEL